MTKVFSFVILIVAYIAYTAIVYTKGTENKIVLTATEASKVDHGKKLFQQYNCIACHQLYGLGGYLGPELTTAYSDENRGEMYMRAFLKGGGLRMPNFHMKDGDVNAIISYLKYVDSTAITYKLR